MLPRAHTCQFIDGEKGRDFSFYAEPGVFCGEPVQEGSPYCATHHRRVYVRRHEPSETAFVPLAGGSIDTAWR